MNENKVKVTDLPKDLIDALNEKEEECSILIEGIKIQKPHKIVKDIQEYVDKLLNENHSEEDSEEFALKLGTLWGKMVVKEYNWKWKYLNFDDGVEGIYIVSPKNYYCCPPLYFLKKNLMKDNAGFDGDNDNTVMLLFNMIENIENKKPSTDYQMIS